MPDRKIERGRTSLFSYAPVRLPTCVVGVSTTPPKRFHRFPVTLRGESTVGAGRLEPPYPTNSMEPREAPYRFWPKKKRRKKERKRGGTRRKLSRPHGVP